MEGKVNKGIYLKEEKDVMLLYYGRYQTSCINNPARCGPEGEHVAPVAVSLRFFGCQVASAPLGGGRCDRAFSSVAEFVRSVTYGLEAGGGWGAGTWNSNRRPVLE